MSAAAGARQVHAGGTVLWRINSGGDTEIAVVHRPKHADWSLPKGKLDPGEDLATAAARETVEETGFAGALGDFLCETRYHVATASGGYEKVVAYWEMRADSGTFRENGEVDALVWLPLAAAIERLTYDRDGDVVRCFAGSQRTG